MTSVLYPTTNLSQLEQLNIVRGEGIYVYDDRGRRYLEGLAGLWCSALGYGNRELIGAITSQLETLSYSHLFGGRTHQGVIELADRLSAMVPVEQGRVFFANSGSEANDSRIKMLHYYFNVIGKPEKKKIIAFDRSYHGVTMASAALTGLPAMHTLFELSRPLIEVRPLFFGLSMVLVLIFLPGGIEGLISKAVVRWLRRNNLTAAERS